MLREWIHDPLTLHLAQAAVAAVLALAVAVAARRCGLRLARETGVALARGLAQIVVVGLALAALMRGPRWTSPILLAAMLGAAAWISIDRLKGIPGAFRLSLGSIALGAGSVIAAMALLGVVDLSPRALIPVGSMVIANAMNGNALALERLRAEVSAHAGEIESALALGAAAQTTVAPYVERALAASLIPSINNLRSLGIVWIPGLMAGMVLSGERPLDASVYQFVVLAMILAASGLTALIGTVWMSRRVFSTAAQLLLRQET